MNNLKALACDFDGSLASGGASGLGTRGALAQVRRAGVRLILVSGRTFFELTRVCECLELFDAVVAENGAVLYYPAAGILSEEGPPPPEAVRRELDRRGVAYQLGHASVSAMRSDEPAVRAALAAAHVNLDVVYNRGMVTLMPQVRRLRGVGRLPVLLPGPRGAHVRRGGKPAGVSPAPRDSR